MLYTDEQLNYLNRGEAVYSVNSEYAGRKNKPFNLCLIRIYLLPI